jgi:hypothetical protein
MNLEKHTQIEFELLEQELLVQQFQVEELEKRYEFAWANEVKATYCQSPTCISYKF